MKQFEVEVKSFITVEADSLREANEYMEKEFGSLETVNFFEVDGAINHEVIGHCEVSGLAIFEGDDYYYDSDGVMWLKEFDDPEEDTPQNAPKELVEQWRQEEAQMCDKAIPNGIVNIQFKLEIVDNIDNDKDIVARVLYPHEGNKILITKGLNRLEVEEVVHHELGHLIDWYLSSGKQEKDKAIREENADEIARILKLSAYACDEDTGLIAQAKTKAAEYAKNIIDPHCNNLDQGTAVLCKRWAEQDFFAGELYMIEVFRLISKEDISIDDHLKKIETIQEDAKKEYLLKSINKLVDSIAYTQYECEQNELQDDINMRLLNLKTDITKLIYGKKNQA